MPKVTSKRPRRRSDAVDTDVTDTDVTDTEEMETDTSETVHPFGTCTPMGVCNCER